MSLYFGQTSGAYVNCGRVAAADNIAAGTIAGWVRVLAWDTAGDYFGVVNKGINTYANYVSLDIMPWAPNIGYADCLIQRATTDLQVRSSVPVAILNKWCFAVFTWDIAGANTDQHVYYGDMSNALQEATYSIQQVGSGAQKDDSANSVGIGNFATPAAGQFYDGGNDREMHWAGLWNKQLTIQELEQIRKETMQGLAKPKGAVLYMYLGRDIGTQQDLSGNNLHGTPGATDTFIRVGQNFPTQLSIVLPSITASSVTGGGPSAKTDGMFFAAA